VLHRFDAGTVDGSSSTEELAWELWAAQQLGALLALTPSPAAVPTQAAGCIALDAFIHAQCGDELDTYGRFARTVHIHANLLRRWRQGRTQPTIDLLLRVCYHLDVSLVAFLHGDTQGLHPDVRSVPTARAMGRKPCQPPAAYDTAKLRQGIEATLDDDTSPPPSAAETARRLGCSPGTLVRMFPEAYRRIADRYRAYRAWQRETRLQHLAANIRLVMCEFDRAGIYPASKRVRARLDQRVHPRNSDYNRIHHQLLQELGWTGEESRRTQDLPVQHTKICNSSLH
jgi:transcriptional regulator with XRE-family HTH domain